MALLTRLVPSYLSMYGVEIQWRFINDCEVHVVDENDDIVEHRAYDERLLKTDYNMIHQNVRSQIN